MVTIPGRNSRRRRVLNEEARSVSSAQAARHSASSSESATQTPRYSDAAGVENHPQITDFVPRRYSTIGLIIATGLAAVTMLGALHYFAPALANIAGLPTLRPFDLTAAGSIAAWISAVLMFVASAACLLIHSIRRHRIDDFKGRYRVWLGAGIACLALSVNSITGLHHVMAHALGHFAGWTALRDDAVWWLVIAGLPLAWIGLRAMFEVKECRVAATFLCLAGACYTACAASYFGFFPSVDEQQASLVTGAALLLGHWLVFAAIVAYSRFVVLDAQGLITVRKPSEKKKQDKANTEIEAQQTEPKPTVLSVVNYTRNKAAVTDAAEDDDRWIDGRRPERTSYESYDDDDEEEESDGGSKLSKAERKRLRKLKVRNRAA